jgi:phosphatidylglycerol:prolipoprotein diacylglycerol transferase
MVFTSPGPILFSWGWLTIRWYGFLIALGVILGTFVAQRVTQFRFLQHWWREYSIILLTPLDRAYWLAVMPKRSRYWQNLPDRVGDLVFWLILGAIPGARAYYVIFSWERYQDVWTRVSLGGWHFSLPSAFAIWEGGIAIHGAILGGSIALYLFCRKHKIKFLQLADGIAPALILGQGIGRWGNFFNSEAFGAPTDLPWKLYIPPDRRPLEYMNNSFFHPTFLYESLWNVGVFLLLLFVLVKYPRSKDGTFIFMYLIFYSLGRLWIEGLRTDSLMFGEIRVAQLISLVAIIFGTIGLQKIYAQR